MLLRYNLQAEQVRNNLSKIMNCAFKMMNSVFKMPLTGKGAAEARIHTGQQAWHLAVMHNRVDALRQIRRAGVDITQPMHCDNTGDNTPAYRKASHLG